MFRNTARIFLTVVLIPLLAGCRYDGSFMQMDSNSGFPFFGLQLAVDSGSRPPDPKEARQSRESSAFDLNPNHFDKPLQKSHSGDGAPSEMSRLVHVRN